MKKIALQTFNLTKYFGDVVAVAAIDLTVYEGEIFGFLGPNGAGKTTTIGMALGLIHPTAGDVELFGETVSPTRTAPLRRVGSLMGKPSLVPYLSGRQNLNLVRRLYADVDDNRVAEVLELVGLTTAAGRAVKSYSTGMKQRLGIAAALLHRPELVILDEPTNGLDPAGMREMRELLGQLSSRGTTVFLSSHLLHEVEQTCDRVAVLKEGRIVAVGRVSELLGPQKLVRVRVPSPAAARKALAPITPEDAFVKINGAYLEIAGLDGEALVRRLVASDIYPSEVTPVGHGLEDVFLTLTSERR